MPHNYYIMRYKYINVMKAQMELKLFKLLTD